jgi:hypothetical protein
MSDMRNAALVLKTSDLTAGSTTTVGDCNTSNTSYTWYGINMRTLLGDLYDNYDLFNLCLNTVISSNAAAGCFMTNEDKIVTINVSGLPFINQTYNQASGHNTNKTMMGGLLFTGGQPSCVSFYSNNIAMFGKSADFCNINITFSRANDGTNPITNGTAFPHSTFIFDIVGVVNDNLTRNKPPQLKSFGH